MVKVTVDDTQTIKKVGIESFSVGNERRGSLTKPYFNEQVDIVLGMLRLARLFPVLNVEW